MQHTCCPPCLPPAMLIDRKQSSRFTIQADSIPTITALLDTCCNEDLRSARPLTPGPSPTGVYRPERGELQLSSRHYNKSERNKS